MACLSDPPRPRRRDVVQALLSALPLSHILSGAPATGTPLQFDRLIQPLLALSWTGLRRYYRVDATLTVLGSSMHTFRGVGSGLLAFHQASTPAGRATSLRFAALSNPETAKGMERLGFIEEVAIERANQPVEYGSFGFITSLHDQRGSSPKGQYTAMDLHAKGATCRFRRSGVAAGSVRDFGALVDHVRGRLPQSGARLEEFDLDGPQPSFLHAVLYAIDGRNRGSDTSYVHNGHQFTLRLDKTADTKAAESFAAKGLIRKGVTIARHDGTIRRAGSSSSAEASGKTWKFTFWSVDGGSRALPLRIEFQPRSLLRLSLEWDQSPPPTGLPSSEPFLIAQRT